MSVDARRACIVGVAARTWHPAGDADAPEPLAMWEDVARAAARDARRPALIEMLEGIDVVYCETWQYDDPVGRLAGRLGCEPRRRHYSAVGGTTPQVLVGRAAEAIRAGDLDLALVVSGEALATRRRYLKAGEPYRCSHPADPPRDYPWDDPLHPSEVAHGAFEAWLNFALFDNARRARLGTALDAYRDEIGSVMAPLTRVAAANPRAWFRTERSARDLVTPTADNRMVGYPYTKHVVAIMDVDMAAAVLVASHEKAEALGIPRELRVYPRGSAYAEEPTSMAARPDLWRAPALERAVRGLSAAANVDVDAVAHFDLYSCFPSSLNFARDAAGIALDDQRPLSVTGGLPYHGGPGSGYVTHALAGLVEHLRDDAGSVGVVSGVGMFMTKHVWAAYSTDPGAATPSAVSAPVGEARRVVGEHDGEARVATYCVVHDRGGDPSWALLVCDLPGGARCYARAEEPAFLARAEHEEMVGAPVRLEPVMRTGLAGESRVNLARSVSA